MRDAAPSTSAHPLLSDAAFPRLKARIIDATGLVYYADKDGALADLVHKRLSALRLPDCASYLDRLGGGSEGESEMDALITDLTIGETYFFRHREQFDALKNAVLPELIRKNAAARRLRVWCAGCSSGEEPYSLSILLKDEFAGALAGWNVSILGTDINRGFLARARESLYGDWAFRSNPEEFRRNHFRPAGGQWALDARYKEGVAFQYHNLVKHPFPSLVQDIAAFDLVFCRNAMIYFSADTCARIIGQFQECLVEGGCLVVGHADLMPFLPRPFQTLQSNGVTLYRKFAGAAGPSLGPAPAAAPLSPVPRSKSLSWTPPVLPECAPFTAPPAAPPAEDAPGLAAVRRLADEGRWEDAAKACRDLLEREKLSPALYFYTAVIAEQRGSLPQAEEALRRAIYLDRGYVLAHYHMGLFLQKRGDMGGAARSFRNVLTLLEKKSAGDPLPDADGMTAANLSELAEMQLDILRTP